MGALRSCSRVPFCVTDVESVSFSHGKPHYVVPYIFTDSFTDLKSKHFVSYDVPYAVTKHIAVLRPYGCSKRQPFFVAVSKSDVGVSRGCHVVPRSGLEDQTSYTHRLCRIGTKRPMLWKGEVELHQSGVSLQK